MYRGDFAVNSTIRLMWNTFAVAGESITRAVNGSIRIYKNNSTTQRSSAAGITDTEDFDAQTGLHHLNIDLSNNTDAGFYAAGNDYMVTISAMTVDGKVINAVIAEFSIENRNAQANLTRIDGLALVAATLNLLKLNVVNAAGDAVVMSSTGGNGTGLLVSGNGTGEGAKLTGGATGNALELVGGATSGSALRATATAGNSHAIEAIGIGSGAGARIKGGATGVGLHAEGGVTAGPGFLAQGVGTAHGIEAEGGTGGGDGIFAQANGGGGDGFEASGNGAGLDIRADEITNIQSRLPAALVGGRMDADVGNMQADTISAAAVSAAAGAEIAGAVIAISLTELAAIPGASPALGDALQLLYMALRNELDTTAVTKVIKNQAGVVIGTATLSDDLVTFRKTRYT